MITIDNEAALYMYLHKYNVQSTFLNYDSISLLYCGILIHIRIYTDTYFNFTFYTIEYVFDINK